MAPLCLTNYFNHGDQISTWKMLHFHHRNINVCQPAFHLMSGCELGPRNGGGGALVFFGFFPPVCFLRRASAAAALSARIFARCSSVKLGLQL